MDASKAERVLREIEGSSGGRWLHIVGRRRRVREGLNLLKIAVQIKLM